MTKFSIRPPGSLLLRLILMAVIFGTGCAPVPQTDPPSASELIEIAGRQAQLDGRVVFIKFRASWCEWCARLDAALHSFELGRLIDDNYVMVDITVQESDDKARLETPGGQDLMDELGGGSAGLPFYAFLDPAGARIVDSNALASGGNIGYPVTEEEIAAFLGLIDHTAPRVGEEDRQIVIDYLTSHGP